MYSVYYGKEEIVFELIRKNVKNINLRVNPNLEVTVSANNGVPLDYIKAFVESKSSWIYRSLEYYRKNKISPKVEKEYIAGEIFRYLGRQYRLKLIKSEKEEVKYFRGHIDLYTKDLDDRDKKRRLMESWYKKRSKIIFKNMVDKAYDRVGSYRIEYPQVDIRRMKSRWGSCHLHKKKIVLNRSLIKAPKDCIEYVALHELVHFIHPNHSREFYGVLDFLMPDWKSKKKILDEVISRDML